ncbi:YbfB/YjiJ family MFS transporter [Rhodovibrio salinarum]|uniref:MFS transporter n=1 Tax=Rhodovibrio salinarum TaxID=1087 RepID=A0A934UZ85_9PROT|nr:YbfB/YjiJ family MFS transporter [Rhodovibrio salinarum]MBK1696927.1 MFS transporter [Rhodovibrio salinarum]
MMPTSRSVHLIACGASATLIGIGLGRFAYAALLPEIVEAGWFTDTQAAYLGAANLLGYFLGAVTASHAATRLGPSMVVRLSVSAVLLSFALCAVPTPFAWFLAWRLLAGVGGAVLMVVAPSAVLAGLVPEDRKTGASFVFAGIGLGVLMSATLVPALATLDLTASWLALAAGIAVLSVWNWPLWRRLDPGADSKPSGDGSADRPAAMPRGVIAAVTTAYALDAIGFVPHTVFWVDLLARQAGHGIAAANVVWALFGVGAVAGPFLAGYAARVLGWHGALTAGLLLKTLAVALPLVSVSLPAAVVSSVLVGALVPGVVALTSGRLAELVGPERHRHTWGFATAVFAAAQAVAAYAMAALYAASGSYLPLFAVGSGALLVGSVILALAPTLLSTDKTATHAGHDT